MAGPNGSRAWALAHFWKIALAAFRKRAGSTPTLRLIHDQRIERHTQRCAPARGGAEAQVRGGVMTHAVLIEVDVAGVERGEGLQGLREGIVPAIRELPGFQSGVWLTGNEAGRGLSLTLWETEENAQTMASRFGVGSSPQASARVVRCELREVAATA
jgi:hypothetical protein